MRAYAQSPTLVATACLLLYCVLAPAGLFARTAAKKHESHPKATHPKAAGRPRSNVHKARRRKKRTILPQATRPALPIELSSATLGSATESATADRVHAWVRSQRTAAAGGPNPGSSDDGGDPPLGVEMGDTRTAANPDSVGAVGTPLPPVADRSAEPDTVPALYNKRGRLIVPPPLKGSHEILLHQNLMADSDGLERVRDDADLDHMRSSGMLVPIPSGGALRIDERLPANRRYCRPWTALFLDTVARQHFARFHTALQVNSAVRTAEFQQRLIHSNGNAAPAEGDTASPHLTGQAVDIAKRGLSLAEIAWLRGYLQPLVQQGKVDVEEEFQQACFHVSVYKKYMPQTQRRVIATTRREGITGIGAILR